MAVYTLSRRWQTGILARVVAESPARAIEAIVEARGSLAYADLKGLVAPRCFLAAADFRGADLEDADLAGSIMGRARFRSASLVAADLRHSILRGADLRGADLRRADLSQADLRDADFTGADLRDARATGARFDGARMDWRSSTFPIELLRRGARLPIGAHRLIAEIALTPDERPYDWLSAVARHPELIGWVASVTYPRIRPGDGAPEVLRRLAVDSVGEVRHPSVDEPTPAAYYWTRAVHPRGTSHPDVP